MFVFVNSSFHDFQLTKGFFSVYGCFKQSLLIFCHPEITVPFRAEPKPETQNREGYTKALKQYLIRQF